MVRAARVGAQVQVVLQADARFASSRARVSFGVFAPFLRRRASRSPAERRTDRSSLGQSSSICAKVAAICGVSEVFQQVDAWRSHRHVVAAGIESTVL